MAQLPVAAVIGIASIAATAVATGVSVYGQNQQSRYAEDVENENRRQGLIAAADALHRGDIEEDAARMRTRQLISTQRALYAGSGVEVGTGSPLTVTQDTAMFGEMDALTIKNNAAREAWGYQTQAQQSGNRAKAERLAGRYGAGATLLTGGSQQLQQFGSLYGGG